MKSRFFRAFAAAAIVWLIGAAPGMACRCQTNASFFEVARAGAVVIRAVVFEHRTLDRGFRPDIATHMELRVLDVLKGFVPGERILVAGDVGNLCRPYVARFPKGTEWFFVLSPRAALRDGIPEFAISICGAHWWPVTDATREKVHDEISRSLK